MIAAALRFRLAPLLLAAVLLAAARADGPAPTLVPPATTGPGRSPESADSKPESPVAGGAVDLGSGLRYFRFTDLAAGSPEFQAALGRTALVADLRRARADTTTAAAFAAGLRPAAHLVYPVFVLIGADTPAVLRAAIPDSPSILTLGAVVGDGAPLRAVRVDASRDRAACDALAAGRSPNELIVEQIDKSRFDEARLARNHANGGGDLGDDATSTPPASLAATDSSPSASAKPTPETPLKDVVLQRAVFIHRALLAHGRLPTPPIPVAPKPAATGAQ